MISSYRDDVLRYKLCYDDEIDSEFRSDLRRSMRKARISALNHGLISSS